MTDINDMGKRSGRVILEDDSYINIADLAGDTNYTNQANGNRTISVETELFRSTFTEEYTADQTDNDIIIPSSGNKLAITYVYIQANANSGVVEMDFATSGDKVARLYASNRNQTAVRIGANTGAEDEPLTLNTTTGADNEVFISINYIELE